jgi:hypothetical protein
VAYVKNSDFPSDWRVYSPLAGSGEKPSAAEFTPVATNSTETGFLSTAEQ